MKLWSAGLRTFKMALLEVNHLALYYHTQKGEVRAVDGVSFRVDQGESLGVVGESGCGKSSLAKAIVKVLPANASIASGEVIFDGRNLVKLENLSSVRLMERDIHDRTERYERA